MKKSILSNILIFYMRLWAYYNFLSSIYIFLCPFFENAINPCLILGKPANLFSCLLFCHLYNVVVNMSPKKNITKLNITRFFSHFRLASSTTNLVSWKLVIPEKHLAPLLYVSTCTSSSLRIGILFTLYFVLSSFDNGEDINFRRTWEGALKYAFLFFRRDDVFSLLNFI